MSLNHLLVVPRMVNTVADWYQFPLGIAYISSALRRAGFSLYTTNLNTTDRSIYATLKDAIEEHRIDVVLTGGLTGQYGIIREIVKGAKQIKPGMVTIVGGGIITSAPEHAMQALEFADYGVIGEGELITPAICTAIENGTDIEQVPGIVFERNGSYWCTGGKLAPVHVDDIPFPDYSGLGLHTVLGSVPNVLGMNEYNTLPIITSRSCPFRCTFCFHPSGLKYRRRSLDNVFAEIDYLVEEFGVKYLSIQDELFGHNKKHVRDFCARIKEYGIKWWANFRVTDVTPQLVATLKDANCATMAFGIESADNRILRSMKKKITIEQTERALKLVYDAGMGIQGVLIFGDVAETVETATTTIEWWKRHIHYQLHLSAVITYPGTELYNNAVSQGIISDPVQYIKDGCPLVRLAKMSDDEYSWLFGQLLSLPRLTQHTPNHAKIEQIDFDNAHMDISGRCESCDTVTKWDNVRLFILETLTCGSCGRKHISPIPDCLVDRVRANIDKLVDHFGPIALWGINSYVYAFFETLGTKLNEQVFFVDNSALRQGVDVSGHTIRSPAIIDDEGIKCVVVLVVQYFTGLKKPIEDEHPEVERVLSISELLSDDILVSLNLSRHESLVGQNMESA